MSCLNTFRKVYEYLTVLVVLASMIWLIYTISYTLKLDEEDLSDVTGLAEDKAKEIENYMNNWEDNKTEAGVIVGICADVILLLTLFVTLCCCKGGCNKKASLLIKNLLLLICTVALAVCAYVTADLWFDVAKIKDMGSSSMDELSDKTGPAFGIVCYVAPTVLTFFDMILTFCLIKYPPKSLDSI